MAKLLLLGLPLVLVAAATARADIDPGAYQAGTALRSKQESERLRRQIEAEARHDAERERLQAEEQARREAERRARMQARPYPVKLLEQRCTGCHLAETYAQTRHTALGWQLVMLRMQWLNGAELDAGDRAQLVAHLARAQGLESSAAITEQALIALPALVALGAAWPLLRSRRRRRPALRKAG